MSNTNWKELIYRDDLTESELSLIPFGSNQNFHVTFKNYINEFNIDENKLINGLNKDNLSNTKKWLTYSDFKKFHTNLFEFSNCFIDHKDFYKIGIEYNNSPKSIPIILVTLISIHYILKKISKITRSFNNTFQPKAIQVGKSHYYIVFDYYPYTKKIVFGHECRFAEGTMIAFCKLMNVKKSISKHLICDKKIETIVKRIYGKYNWKYADDGQHISINNKVIGRYVQLKKVNFKNQSVFINEIDENPTTTNAIQIIDDFYFHDRCVFEKGEIYNAPYCIIELKWEENSFYQGLYNFFIKRFKLRRVAIKELENQIQFTNKQMFKLQKVSEELRQERNSLEQKIRDRTADLKKANEKLLELDKLKTEFYTNITHELRTPLTLIKSQIEAIKQGHFGPSIKNSSDIFDSVNRNANLLTKLINNLLDFSKIESGKMNVSLEKTDLSKFLNFIISNIESAAEYKNLTCKFIDKTHDLEVNIDQGLYEKAIYNLLSNAIKFTPSGGHIILILDEDEHVIFISVKDTGIGIAKENQEIIFERFRQIDSSSTRKYEGTGIGLSLTREIVNLHKGGIKVSSEPDEGSTFTITIPKNIEVISKKAIDSYKSIEIMGESQPNTLDKKLYEIKSGDEAKSHNKINSFTVLVVEDNGDLCVFLKSIIIPKHNVYTAKNGIEALSKLKHQEVDLVISDIMMPEMDGLELLKTIRLDNHLSWLPVIMLTARADFPMKMKGFSHGANDYIIKPFQPDELLARIHSQLSLVNLRREYKLALKNKNEKKLTDKTIVAIEKVKIYIQSNYNDSISRENLSSVVDMSPDHLSRMFKKHTGKKISDFVNELRIENILEELESNEEKIVDIAYEAGFESLSSFNRTFKRINGMTPTEYKKKRRKSSTIS